jgi:hypothetical protein
MTQDEIYDMAHQAGVENEFNYDFKLSLETFAKLVADKATAKEREACANLCDEFNFGQTPMMIQRAIRARGEQA